MAKGKVDKANKLTPKQDAFAAAFFETGNATEAYRQAYDVNENSRDSWIHVEACQLLDNPKVAQRVTELRKKAEKHAIYSRHKAMEELEEARKLALESGQSSAAVSAVSAKIKLTGLDRPLRVEHSGPNGQPIEVRDLSKLSDAALAELAALETPND